MISIHALREEGDPYPLGLTDQQQNFYPRPPRGGRRLHHAALEPALLFLSTPSARRATDGLRSNLQTQLISIHALREEGDRAAQLARASAAEAISIHALREEGDRWSV